VAFGLAAARRRLGDQACVRSEGQLLPVLFGTGDWPEGWGLYLNARAGSELRANGEIEITTGVYPGTQETWCLAASLRFFPLLLSLGRPDLPEGAHRPIGVVLNREQDAVTKTLNLMWPTASDKGCHPS